jgi:hypothetical protein
MGFKFIKSEPCFSIFLTQSEPCFGTFLTQSEPCSGVFLTQSEPCFGIFERVTKLFLGFQKIDGIKHYPVADFLMKKEY